MISCIDTVWPENRVKTQRGEIEVSLENGNNNKEINENNEVERQREIQEQESVKNAETKRRGESLDKQQGFSPKEKTEVKPEKTEEKATEVKPENPEENKKEDVPESKGHNMSELKENADIVKASEIDMTYARDMESEKFWDQELHNKETFMKLAEHIPEVQEQLDSGKSLDEIREDPKLSDTVTAYFDPKNMIKVEEQQDGSYAFQDDGRHRIAAAQEFGYEIPVDVVNKGEFRKEESELKEENEEKDSPKTLQEIMDNKEAPKSMESLTENFDNLTEGFDNALYDGMDKKSRTESMEKMYGENAEAIHDIYGKKREVDQRKEEIMNEIRDMHMKDEDVTIENNPKLKELSDEYYKCEDESHKLDYMQTKLEDNNKQIAEATDLEYVATSDEFMPTGGPRETADYFEKYLDSSLEKLDNQESSAVDAYAFAQIKDRLGDSINKLEGARMSDGPAVPDQKVEELRGKLETLGSRYAEEYKECKFNPDGTYEKSEKKQTAEKELFAGEIKNDHSEHSFAVKKGSREVTLDENRTIFSDRVNRSVKTERNDGIKVEGRSAHIDAQGYMSENKFTAGMLNSEVKKEYNSEKNSVSSKRETNLAKVETEQNMETKEGKERTQKTFTFMHNSAEGKISANPESGLKAKGEYASSIAEVKYEHTYFSRGKEGELEEDRKTEASASVGNIHLKADAELSKDERKIHTEASRNIAEAKAAYTQRYQDQELKTEVSGTVGEQKVEGTADLKNMNIKAEIKESVISGKAGMELNTAGSERSKDHVQLGSKEVNIGGHKTVFGSDGLQELSSRLKEINEDRKKISKIGSLIRKKPEE